MRAAVVRRGAGSPESTAASIEVDEIDDPTPGSGHVLVRSLACGICGSDLHAAQDIDQFVELGRRVGTGVDHLDVDEGVVFGHEFCAEIVDYGPDTTRSLPVGTRVCSVPTVLGATGPQAVGYSNHYPGGLAELMVLQEMLLLPVPDDLPTDTAALTEPLAVGSTPWPSPISRATRCAWWWAVGRWAWR
jgi:threonine dehydrogenase-like Zn-dependent dehydrogenase